MNYAYLFIDNLNGHSYESGLDQIKYSIKKLKKNINSTDKIIVFNNETSGKNVEYFKSEGIDHHCIELSRNYKGSDKINPISILVEKIICLMNFDEHQDIVLMDIDTTSVNELPNNFWGGEVVFDNIEYPIMQWRNLDKVLPRIPWDIFDIAFDNSFIMYNTGVIYIPKLYRKEICQKALKIVDYLNNNFDAEERCGNKLDEQIALSIVCQEYYGKYDLIKLSNNYIHHHWQDSQNNIKWWEFEEFDQKNYFYKFSEIRGKKIHNKLPLSIGILSWNSSTTLRNTLESYRKNGLLDIANDITILFQEFSDEDLKIAREYNLPFISLSENIGIGNAFIKLSNNAKTNNLLLLEHDWELIENEEITYQRLCKGIDLLESGYKCVRFRHRKNPGYPLYSRQAYEGKELEHYDKSLDLLSPHLIESIHWIENPELKFLDKIKKIEDFFVTTSRWSNFTNNPCLYKKDFYINTVNQFNDSKEKDSKYYEIFENNLGNYNFVDPQKHSLEYDIGYWWSRQEFKIAQGEGLFSHNDIEKYQNLDKTQKSISFIFAHRDTDKWSTPLSVVNEFKRLGWKTKIYSLFDSNDNYTDENIYDILNTSPDIIFYMDFGQHISPILNELKKTGAFCIMESADDPQRFYANKEKALNFDLILSPDLRCVDNYKKMGLNVEWWTHFSDTNVYFPLENELKYIAVSSRGMRNDASIIDNLATKYPNQIKNQNGFIADEHNEFLNSGFIVLQQSRYGEITRRIFEGMSCKKLVIADRLDSSTNIQSLFVDGEDIIFYDNEFDCLEKIFYYSNNREIAQKIAENGYKKVLEYHTQKQRVDLILEKWKLNTQTK